MEVEAENGEKTFIVTQMINPSYFHLFNPYLRDDKARIALEESLLTEIQNYEHFGANKKFKKGDIVAFYWQDGKRYIRCEIDDIKLFNYSFHYFLFALDYGVSLFTTRAEDIHPVSEIIKFAKSPIMNKVALNVLPIITRFDYLNDKEEVLFHSSWSPLALTLFQQSLDKASIISFEMSNNTTNGFLFGDLIITTFYGIQFSLSDALINAKVAKRASSQEEFEKHFNRLQERNIERWNDNSKTGGILKYEEGKLPLFYDDEIQIKQYITNCEIVQSRKESVQKVIEWQQKNEIYDRITNNDDDDDDSNDEWNVMPVESIRQNVTVIANEKDDEGFDEALENLKRKNGHKFEPSNSKSATKKLKCETANESIFSGISRSVSQMFNRNC